MKNPSNVFRREAQKKEMANDPTNNLSKIVGLKIIAEAMEER